MLHFFTFFVDFGLLHVVNATSIFLLSLIVLFAFATEAALGFGGTLITVTLAAFLMPIQDVLPAFVPLNVCLSLFLSIRYFKSVDFRFLFTRLLPLMLLGLPLGAWGFQKLNQELLKSVFGLFIAILSVIELRRLYRIEDAFLVASSEKKSIQGNVSSLEALRTSAGPSLLLLLGGVAHGAFATGGPMAVYVTGRTIFDKGVFRSTLSLLWLLLNTVLVVVFVMSKQIQLTSLKLSGWLAIALVLGIGVGEWAHRRVPMVTFRRMVFWGLLVGGLVLSTRSSVQYFGR